MASSRSIVKKTLQFQYPERLAYDFPEKYGTDFYWSGLKPSPDDRPRSGVDEWGAVWENIGSMNLGQVKDFPLKDWDDLDHLSIPDIHDPKRWTRLERIREQAQDLFLLGDGISIYERVHFIRGLENTWMDILNAPGELGNLIDILVEMNLAAIQRYASLGFDGLIFPDDWGLQNRLMISPTNWRKIWKPRYARIFKAAHTAGLHTFLHSCGYIVDILDDLIEIGLEAIHMDQQENMGLELLGKRFGGRLTFFAPVDIQRTMANGSLDEIRQYCRSMVHWLGRPEGGFIPRWYGDPIGAGHRQEAIDAMCEEFLKINQNLPAYFKQPV
jgi:uroporphyrinogen decarboxylase